MNRFACFQSIARILPAGLLISLGTSHAQQLPAISPPLAAPEYRSVFDGYRQYSDERVSSWRDANDTVGRIGGWRTYAREVHPPSPATPAATPSQQQPADAAPAGTPPPGPAGGHAGHHGAKP